ncbi:MAG: hypothetical protein QM718_14300 [Steroidobacteraceae bacterium]
MNAPASPIVYSRARILRATLLALLVAALLTVLVVMPAEYGKDLTGFGRLTGLVALSGARGQAAVSGAASAAPAAAVAATPASADADADVVDATADGQAPPLGVWAHAHPDAWQNAHFEVQLKGDEELEYKAVVKRGEPLFYRWRVKQGSQVYFEFHGEPTAGKWPAEYYESYEKGESTGGQGSMVAPFTGNHGWYWLNLSATPVTIEVDLVGYYANFGRIGPAPQ